MPDTQPTATVAGQSIALNVTGYPDVPNRWGTGHIRVTAIRLDYGNTRTPDGRHAFITGLWVREGGEVTDQPIDQYYDAPTGDTSTWPDWIAELARKHTPGLPCRDDAVEAWLKAQRDAAADYPEAHQATDGLLDLYRLHADTGTPLGEHVCEGQAVGDCECFEKPAKRPQMDPVHILGIKPDQEA